MAICPWCNKKRAFLFGYMWRPYESRTGPNGFNDIDDDDGGDDTLPAATGIWHCLLTTSYSSLQENRRREMKGAESLPSRAEDTQSGHLATVHEEQDRHNNNNNGEMFKVAQHLTPWFHLIILCVRFSQGRLATAAVSVVSTGKSIDRLLRVYGLLAVR